MRNSPVPSCVLHKQVKGFCRFSFLISLSHILLFQVAVALPSRFPAVVTPPTSTSIENKQEPNVSVSVPSEVSKRLLDLNSCISDTQCWGRGRRCIEGRCWGFAGPRHTPFKCGAGSVCKLNHINGHFYGDGSRSSRGLFMLQAIRGPLTDCGTAGDLNKAALCEDESLDCVLSEAGDQRKISGFAALGDRDNFVVGAPTRCIYTPGITAQSACSARLGFIHSSIPVGQYALCGCSSTDLGANGQPCTSEADFSVPIGTLEITGFPSPAVSSSPPGVAAAAAVAAAPTGKEEKSVSVARKGEEAAAAAADTVGDTEPLEAVPSPDKKVLLLPRFSCTVGIPCELPGIRGHGLMTTEHFVRAFPGVHGSCEEPARTSVPLRLPCSAASGGTRCIVSVRPEDIKALMHPTAAADGKEKEASAVDVTLCGCRKGLRPTDCLGATLVGLLRLRNDEQPLQHQEEQQQQQQQQQQRQQQQQHSLQHQQAQKQPHQQLRKLQFIEDRAANLPEEDDPDAPVGGECQKHLDCLGGYGKCVSGRCRGFIPDVKEERLIRCVEGYHCDAGKGDIPTRGNKENFTVIAIGPDEECGAAVNLKPEGSIFNNANKWICSSSPSSSCELRFGVARRLNRGNTVEGLRLCGCPALDVNGDSLPCNHMRDFRVPLGRVSVQECITNAHCADRQLAYCIKDHCGGFLVSAAAAGVHAFACVRNQDCTIENVAARGVSEALKVIPIAAHLKCGSEAALDPNFLPESAMPCVADVDADGKCDVHLGVNHFFGTHRLCGCSGADVGGSGMGCDEAADFGVELGLLNTVECVVHSDCPIHSLCAKGECVSDDLPPTLVATEPSAGSIVVPPLKQIELQFNEDVVFGRPGASLVVACLSPDIKWVITLPEEAQELKIIKHNPSLFPRTPKRATAPAAESSGSSKWMLERQGQRLRVTPDEDLSSLPAGEYLVSLEFGFVTDLTGNPCEVPPPLSFTLARDAGCPLLYATGFATENGNTNGLYTPIDPVNNHAAWRGAEGNAFFIYYRKETEGEPGNWVLDTDLDESAFLGFADLSLLTGGLHEGSRKAAGPSVPPTGLWHKWTGKKKEEQPFVAFICRDTADHVPPTLTDVHPPSKSAAGGPHLLRLDSTTAVPLEPITLVFNKPINYGHWAALRLIPRGSEVPVAEWVTDQEAGMRGEGGSVLIRSPSPPSKKASRKPQGAPGASQEPQGQPEGSEGAGVVELLLEEPLEGGKEYDLVADLGAFTDFSYNPWGPLAPQTVTFLAAATHCPLRIGAAAAAAAAEAAEPDGPEAQAAAGDETSYEMLTTSPEGDPEGRAEEKKASPAPEGTVATVRCAAGLAVPSDLAEGDSGVAGVLRCKGGKWEGPLIPCVPVCGPYPALGDAYEIEDLDELAEEGLSGVSVTIRCAGAVAGSAQQQQQQQTVTCHGGKWGQLSLKCAASCPPLKPSLGRNYDVFLPDVSAAAAAEAIDGETGAAAAGPGEMEAAVSAREGEERIVECSISSVPSNPEMQQQIVRCTAQGWMPEVTLSCKGACRYPPISPEGAKLQGEGLHHGSVWTAECLEGYAGPPGVSSAEFVCEDGLWVRHQSEGSPFSCAPVCPSLTLNPTAYKVTPIAAAAGAAAGAAANQVQIECAEGSLLLGGPPSEVLKCERGLWGLRSTTCAASCLNPIEELGKHYSLLQQQQQQQELYRHGETVDITCTENQSSSPTAASKPHTITCVDGVWQSAPHVPRQQQQQDPDVPPAAGSSSSSSSGVSLRCSATCGLPPLAAHFSILSSTGRGPPRGPLKSVWREGEKLFVGCSPPFDASLLLPAGAREQRLQQQEQQQQVLQCRDGAWVGELKDSVCVRPCPGAPDGPPASKWKELGVACGAPCSSRCGSCYNGKRDKEEEGVDCGGPFCLPCSSCSPFPLKQFVLQPRLYSSSIKQQQRQQQQTDFPVEFTQHGSKISFSCVSSPALSLRVICSNGRWTAAGVATAAPAAGTAAEDAARLSAFAAACVQADVRASEASSSSSSSASGAARPRAISAATAASERMDEELLLVGAAAGAAGVEHPLQWREPELLRFGAPLLRPFPAIPQQHQQQQQQQQQQLSPCVSELVAAVSRLLVGECGALAFGGSSFKVASFCKGTCSATYKQQLQQARECSSKTAAAIAAADPTAAAAVKDQQLLQQFEQLLQVFCEVYEGKHCFAEAGDTLELLQRLHQTPLLLQQLRQQACPGSSGEKCFSSNIRYISVLQQLRQHVDLQLPGMQQQDQQQHAAAAAAAAQRGKGSQEGLIDVGVKGLLTDLGRLPAITSLLCAEVEGQSCAPQVLSLGTQNPFAALPAPEAAATFCSSNPAAPCLLEAYRLVGQKLLQPPPQQQQQQELHPYDWTLGTAMLSVGRNFCLRSAEDQTCGALLLPAAVTDAAKAAAAAEDRPYVPASAAELPRCTCPLAFVGDGECDSSCNTAACAFDRGDCLAQNQLLLQPLMESLEANTIPRGDTCFPFLQGFDCRRKDCRLTMQELQSRHGCCFASQVELLRDLLAIDEQQQQQQRQQLQLLLQQAPEAVTPQLMHLIETDWEAAGSGGPPMEYYRSIAFLEADCKMQLDRTCSRGLNRFAFAVDATLEGLRHEALKTSSSIGSGSREEEALRHVLRDILAAAFGVPLGDVLLVRLWRGLDVHAVIDTGPLSNKAHFLQTVETLRSDGPSGLASLLLTELKRQEAAATTAHKQQLLVPQQQQPWGPLSLHRVPLLLEASVFSPPVSVPPSELTISQIAFSSPGSSSINSSSRRQQEQQEHQPEKGTWGLGTIIPKDVPCSTNGGLSAPPNVSVFEVYRLHSSSSVNPHGSVITVECGRGYSPVSGSSPQQLICQQGRWGPKEGPPGAPPERILRCRKPCGPYESSDPLVLGPAFVTSGLGETDGDKRAIYCASGFVAAAAAMPKTDSVVCTNGSWSRRQLECIKDFSAIADSSPCASSLSLLPPSLKVETIQMGGGSGTGPGGSPGVSSEVAAALAATFQRAGVSLQLFRVGCARGFVAAPTHQQQQQQPFAYAACKDGMLLDLGSQDPLPMGAFASGEAAEALVQQLKLRVEAAPEATAAEAAASETETEEETSSVADVPLLVDGDAAAAAMKGSLKGPMVLGASLGCERELRQEPAKVPKPVSDTLLVFVCLLLLFVLVVALLLFWWMRARHREKKAAKQQQQQLDHQQDDDPRAETSSGIGGGLISPSEGQAASYLGLGPAMPPFGGILQQQQRVTNNAALYEQQGTMGGSLSYPLDGEGQQRSRQRGGVCSGPPLFPSEEAAAAAAEVDEHSLALYAPVYYTGLSGDKGLVRDDNESSFSGAADAARPLNEAEMLRRMEQQQVERKMLQQHSAAAAARRGELRPTDAFRVRGHNAAAVSTACIAAAAADQQQQHVHAAAAWGSHQQTGGRGSLPGYQEPNEPLRQPQQLRQQQQLLHAVSRKAKASSDGAVGATGDSALTSGGGQLSEEEELYPDDSASCVAMTANQRREAGGGAAGALATSTGGALRVPKSRAGAHKHLSAAQGQSNGRAARIALPSLESVHRRHAQA